MVQSVLTFFTATYFAIVGFLGIQPQVSAPSAPVLETIDMGDYVIQGRNIPIYVSTSPSPTKKPVVYIPPVLTPTPFPTAVPTMVSTSPVSNKTPASVTNTTNNYYLAPTIVPTFVEEAVDYSEALKRAEEESNRIHAKCIEWENERDLALAPLKQESDSAYQKYQNEITAIDNNTQMSEIQKNKRKTSVAERLLVPFLDANREYLNASSNYGNCPY